MNKKLLSILLGVVVIVGAGLYFYNYISKQNLIIAYIDDSDAIAMELGQVILEEELIEDYDELLAFTEEYSLPRLHELLSELHDLRVEYNHKKVLEVHELLEQSFEKAIEGNELWVNEDYVASDRAFIESDYLYVQYEEDLEKLANSWNVEIIYEEE
ncbi:hypothetical protein [Alkalihalobacillus pseudalcaliphilus]|uniref:hypothetical protein n=1 Tax=Alkalihalobacillus pseudalcaliphilus TaxID=79884 RepID=UPI00064E0EA8|nr:hypothetical protein [Alkalihalobacillus pseudalcaliphilus]KMK77640.1 hypothetical protein AB990_04065 [Alkalihalobacillus pseudalcaliphilus]